MRSTPASSQASISLADLLLAPHVVVHRHRCNTKTGCVTATKRSLMTKAIIIWNDNATAIGFAVVERRGLRFYAADSRLRPMDDRTFRNFKEIQCTAAALAAVAPTG